MNFRTDRVSCSLKSQPNFSLLDESISGFHASRVTGFATLAETPFLKHLRLLFFGTGEFGGTVLCGPAFSPFLLEISGFAPELRVVAEEFLDQIRRLENAPSADQVLSRGIVGIPCRCQALSA